jgi:hypothetical protein
MRSFVSTTLVLGLWFGGVRAQEEDGGDFEGPVDGDTGDRTNSGPCVRNQLGW